MQHVRAEQRDGADVKLPADEINFLLLFSFKKKKVVWLEHGIEIFKTIHNSSFGVQNRANTLRTLLQMFTFLLQMLSYHTSFLEKEDAELWSIFVCECGYNLISLVILVYWLKVYTDSQVPSVLLGHQLGLQFYKLSCCQAVPSTVGCEVIRMK